MDDRAHVIASAVDRLIAAGLRQRGALAKGLEWAATDVLALHHVVTGPECAPGTLARALMLSPSGATAVIGRLSRAGLVTRTRGPGRPRVALKATDAGRELHAEKFPAWSETVRPLIEDMPGSHRVLVEQFLTRLADLVEQEADGLIARAEADARAATAIPPPVLWG
jgi:DNA-binding MarR family transcriptional regulator